MYTIRSLGTNYGKFGTVDSAEQYLLGKGWTWNDHKRVFTLFSRGLSPARHLRAAIVEIPKLEIESVRKMPTEAGLRRMAKLAKKK